MTLRPAFHHATAGGTPEAPHEQGIEKSIKISTGKPMPPNMAPVAAGTFCRLLPRKFPPKKVYLLEIHVNK
jgi:hypothetical protein